MTIYETLAAAIAAEQPVATATIVQGGAHVGAKLLARPDGATMGSLGGLSETQIIADMLAMLERAESAIRSYPSPEGDVEVFIETFPPPPTMFLVGAVHIAIALVTFAKTLGFHTVVIDARGAFATEERFNHADELVHAWPDEALQGGTAIGVDADVMVERSVAGRGGRPREVEGTEATGRQ